MFTPTPFTHTYAHTGDADTDAEAYLPTPALIQIANIKILGNAVHPNTLHDWLMKSQDARQVNNVH